MRQKFSDQVLTFIFVFLPTGSISSGNLILLAFDVIDSKVPKIAGNTIITIGNEESGPWQQHNNILGPKLVTEALAVVSYSNDYDSIPTSKIARGLDVWKLEFNGSFSQ